MNIVQGFLSLLGRVLLASIFLIAIRNHFLQFEGINQAIKARQIPAPSVVHVLAIGCMALGGVSLVLGYKARIGALLLLIFLGVAGYYFHNFWHLAGGVDREDARRSSSRT